MPRLASSTGIDLGNGLAESRRLRIAFLDYPDVFEDFYPHYGIDQSAFARTRVGAGNHAFLSVLQREVGDVTWYVFSLRPELTSSVHESVGCQIRFLRSSWLHRLLWNSYYGSGISRRWPGLFRFYGALASWLAPLTCSFLRELWRNPPDVFFVQGYTSGRFDIMLLIAHFLHRPIIAWHAGGRPEICLAPAMRRRTLPKADRIIVSGRDEYTLLTDRFGVSRDRPALILTPVDMKAYSPHDRRAACLELGLDPGRRYFLFVGRLEDSVKRISSMIRAFSRLAPQHADADLLIVGHGPDAGALRQLANELAPGRVQFYGWVSDAQKAHFYTAAECLLLASSRETFPAVVGEAMACGTPVISSRVGGVSELVISGETGWLFPPENDIALEAAMFEALIRPDLVARMRVRARRIAEERVSPAVVASALRDCFSVARVER